MKTTQDNVLDMVDRLVEYHANHLPEPPATAVPRVEILFTEAATVAGDLRRYLDQQVGGSSAFRGGATNRSQLKAVLIERLRELNKIARSLDRDDFPTARDHFRLPQSRTYANVIATARSFATHAAAMPAAFIDRGRPATFIADLRALATEVETAAAPKNEGRQAQVGGTAGLEAKARRGTAIMRELDAILSPLLASDPAKLATWKSAARLVRRTAPANTPAPPVAAPPAAS